ncbi:hypothetical protein BGX24_001460 [Mortierella sp. AD032]|nr:hypothetical protein BGX24_001460 [Mortierella sp. AD032]
MNCSDAPIIFERGRNFSIVQVDSDDDMTRHIVRSPPLQGRISTRRDRSALDPGGGGRDVLESDDEEELYLVDVEGRSSIGHGHGPAGSSRSARQQKSQYLPDPTRGVNSDMRSKSDTSLSSSLKVDPVLQSPTPPKSAPPSTSTTLGDDDGPFNSFSTAFIAVDQRNVGYSSHHFACFLQILYGLLHPVYLHEDDLLAVFRIAHIYGVPSLVSFLGERIWDTLELTTKTWPCLVRFSEKFCLENIKRRALMHASETRELWTVAVENLGLDDFKVFLRGIGQPDDGAKASVTGGREQKGDLRSLKDELLMMFLLVHYQDSASSKEFGSFLFHRDDEAAP